MLKMRDKKQCIITFVLLTGIWLYGCGNTAADLSVNVKSVERSLRDIQESVYEQNMEDEQTVRLTEEEPGMPIDYKELEEAGYGIREKNICVNPLPVLENQMLCEQEKIKNYIEFMELEIKLHMENDMHMPVEYAMDYFLHDLNDDGIYEYIVSFAGCGFEGSSGNSVCICRKTDEGLEEMNGITAQVYKGPNMTAYEKYGYQAYWPIAVLEKETGGYHAFVLTWSGNTVWEYNVEAARYG